MIPVARPDLSGRERELVADCVDTSWISSTGTYLVEFEQEFARFCEARHAVACNNGTTALHLALAALGVGPGDEVVVPTLTYVASANAVTYCGADVVLVDVDPGTGCLDVEAVARRLGPRTAAVMPVHLYGRTPDMTALGDLCAQHGVPVVEDAAEAHGARFGGRRVGSLGDCASFSFFGNKIVTTGEGGAVTTDDDDLAERLRLMRGQGMDPQRRYWFPVVGFNYRMTNLAAAIGVAQLERVDRMLAARQEVARTYERELGGHVEFLTSVPGTDPVDWLVTVLLPRGVDRDAVMARMAEDGVETRPVFVPMHHLPMYRRPGESFPVADDLSRRGVSLPTWVGLQEEDVVRVSRLLRAAVGAAR